MYIAVPTILTIVVFGFNSQTVKSRHNRCNNYDIIMPSAYYKIYTRITFIFHVYATTYYGRLGEKTSLSESTFAGECKSILYAAE